MMKGDIGVEEEGVVVDGRGRGVFGETNRGGKRAGWSLNRRPKTFPNIGAAGGRSGVHFFTEVN